MFFGDIILHFFELVNIWLNFECGTVISALVIYNATLTSPQCHTYPSSRTGKCGMGTVDSANYYTTASLPGGYYVVNKYKTKWQYINLKISVSKGDMMKGCIKAFILLGGQMEEILVIIYSLFWYLLDQPRTAGVDSFILKWTRCNPTIKAYLGWWIFPLLTWSLV